MSELLAFITIISWLVIPLFWIPVHSAIKIFKKIGFLTYIMPLITWIPLVYIIYKNRAFILHFKIDIPLALNITGIALLVLGTLLHIWTGRILGLWGLIGLPEVSRRVKGRLVTGGPFSIIRHPTYLAHTLIFSGVFLITEVIAVAIITFLDLLLIHLLIIPLEEKELLNRFGEEYKTYKGRVPRFFPQAHRFKI